VKHRPRIEKLAIELETTVLSGQRSPVIDAARVVEQQCTFAIADELRNLMGESRVGNADSFDRERLSSVNVMRFSCRMILNVIRRAKSPLAGNCRS
jgi:hypothetical protein